MTRVVVATYLEVADKKSFASAVDWPGWCRSAKDGDAALTSLLAYGARYAVVAHHAGLAFADAGLEAEVTERVSGSASTDFGVPAAICDGDRRALRPPEAHQQAKLVAAAWDVLDNVVANAPPVLRKGPRGGGRDRDEIAAHVRDAETAYARKLGIRMRNPDPGELRAALLSVLGSSSSGEPIVERGWPSRYGARRIAWHVLDHAWEIEDKSV